MVKLDQGVGRRREGEGFGLGDGWVRALGTDVGSMEDGGWSRRVHSEVPAKHSREVHMVGCMEQVAGQASGLGLHP